MKSNLEKISSILNNLELIDENKFSSIDFKDINEAFEKELKKVTSECESKNNLSFSFDDKLLIQRIINKIETLETKVLPKAQLINSFSKSVA